MRDTRSLAAYYLETERELSRILEGHSDSELTRELATSEYPHALMRVDAAVGAALGMLEGKNYESTQSPRPLLSSALRSEGDFWHRVSPRTSDFHTEPIGGDRGTPIKLLARAEIVAQHLYRLSLSWRDGEPNQVRTFLGAPARDYFSRLFDIAQEVDAQDSGTTGENRAQPAMSAGFWWPVSVDTNNEVGHTSERTTGVTLDRILLELAFDEFNLRAMFEMRRAEMAFIDALAPDSYGDQGGETPQSGLTLARWEELQSDKAMNAAHQLLRAISLTEGNRSRLLAISRLITSIDLLDGRTVSGAQTNLASTGEANLSEKEKLQVRAAAARLRVRERASRALAEASLHVLNEALFSSTSDSQGPWPPSTMEVHYAYTRAIGALNSNWILPDASAKNKGSLVSGTDQHVHSFSTTPDVATLLDLERLLESDLLWRLGVDTGTYRDVIHMLSLRRLRLSARSTGSLIQQGLSLCSIEQAEICAHFGTPTCSAKALNLKVIAEGARNSSAKKKGEMDQMAMNCEQTKKACGASCSSAVCIPMAAQESPPDKSDSAQTKNLKKKLKRTIAQIRDLYPAVANYEKHRELFVRYCELSLIASSIIEDATSTKVDISLLERSRLHLTPLSEGEIRAHLSRMRAERGECANLLEQ